MDSSWFNKDLCVLSGWNKKNTQPCFGFALCIMPGHLHHDHTSTMNFRSRICWIDGRISYRRKTYFVTLHINPDYIFKADFCHEIVIRVHYSLLTFCKVWKLWTILTLFRISMFMLEKNIQNNKKLLFRKNLSDFEFIIWSASSCFQNTPKFSFCNNSYQNYLLLKKEHFIKIA